MAAYLGRKGVPVALVVPFDCTKSFAASDNVARVLNLTHSGTLTYMRGGPGFHGTLANVDVSSDPSIDHINIDKSPRLHARVVAEVLAVVGNHKTASAKKGNGADAGAMRPATLPEQGGSRQNADNPTPPPHNRQPVRNQFRYRINTCSIDRALGDEVVARIFRTIVVYDDFCHENDPYEEHDFGAFEVDGHTMFSRSIITIRPSPATLTIRPIQSPTA